VDRRLDLAGRSLLERLNKRRWYGFVRMQGRVARRAGPLITVSSSSKDDICRDFRVNQEKVHIIPLGVDTRLFRPQPAQPRVPGRVVTVTSADSPL
jgi:glycosyltransferase involved in cell wall biosynthesis